MSFNWSSLLGALGLMGAFLLVNKFPAETALRPWTAVGSSAYVETVNNSRLDLPVVVRAPAVDSTERYLGMVPKCGHVRFKLPYVDTKVILTLGSVSDTMNIDGPGVWTVTIFDQKNPCPEISKIAVGVLNFVDPVKWQSSPWFRPGNLGTPVKLVLAGDNTVCAVYDQEIVETRIGDVYLCKTGWIVPR